MPLKIAFFSFADIDNFGDILFSHIFKMEMERRLDQVIIDFYSPSSYQAEGIQYMPYSREMIAQNRYDALIVFGGEVIHLYDDRTWKPIYAKNGQQVISGLPSDVIFDWTNIELPFKAWISVGVRPIEHEADLIKIQQAINQLDYVSVRGALSKKILENLVLQENNSKINLTPDMGWLFPQLLDYKDQKGEHYKKYVPGSSYLIFQINNITVEEAQEIATYLYDFKIKNNVEIVLLPVIRPWEDNKFLKMIDECQPNAFHLLPNNLTILEIADVIVHAELVLTSSLHANITALSAGIPAGIINKWQGTKLQDLYGHQFRLHMLKHNLNEIPVLLENLLQERSNNREHLTLYASFMKMSLSRTMDQLVQDIQNKRDSLLGES